MRVLAIISLGFMMACQPSDPMPVQVLPATASMAIPEELAQQAEQVASRDIAERYPSANAGAAANCVRDHATSGELIALSEGALHSITDEIRGTVDAIVNRSATRTCIRDNGTSLAG